MKPKMRLVSVRLSQDEYDRLKSISAEHAWGSVSGLIRASMHGIMLHGHRTVIDLLSKSNSSSSCLATSQSTAIQLIERRIESLADEMKRLRAATGDFGTPTNVATACNPEGGGGK